MKFQSSIPAHVTLKTRNERLGLSLPESVRWSDWRIIFALSDCSIGFETHVRLEAWRIAKSTGYKRKPSLSDRKLEPW